MPQRSNLFESHWSNQWFTNFSYSGEHDEIVWVNCRYSESGS